jgi:hypothetical protein
VKRFLILASIATFFFSYALFNNGDIAMAIGGAIFLTVIGWIVARSSSPRYGTLAIALLAVFAWMGR